jgi:uncharacterized membrane protein
MTDDCLWWHQRTKNKAKRYIRLALTVALFGACIAITVVNVVKYPIMALLVVGVFLVFAFVAWLTEDDDDVLDAPLISTQEGTEP